MQAYLELVKKVFAEGELRKDRTGVGTRSLFGEQIKFDLQEGFPATTVKTLAFRQVAGELAGFLRGYDNLKQFHELGVKIWDANGKAPYWSPRREGDLGRIYGVQWRDFHGMTCAVDQLVELVDGLRKDPMSRRHIVTAWQPAELHLQCLPPCHVLFQCYVSADNAWLDLRVDMRSVDLFLGMPFDVASYALMMHLICNTTKHKPRHLVFQLGDAHIYNNHVEQVTTMLARRPTKLPKLRLTEDASVFNFHPDMASLIDYFPQAAIKAEMAV